MTRPSTDVPVEQASEERIHLLLSGGGFRSMLGSLGVILYLMHAKRWDNVVEIASVSGGSVANAALVGGRDQDDLTRLRRFHEALLNDRARPFKSLRRGRLVLTLLVVIAGVVFVIVGLLRDARAPVLPHALQPLLFGIILVPLLLQAVRKIGSRYLRDTLETVTGSRHRSLADTQQDLVASGLDRQHVFCASGLASGTPYFFLLGGAADESSHPADGWMTWGFPIAPWHPQNDYTIGDAVFASASLPLLGGVMSPRRSSSGNGDVYDVAFAEPLVDGGGSGVFGQQVRDWFITDPGDIGAGFEANQTVTSIVVDGFRHTAPPTDSFMSRVGSFARNHLSSLLYLLGWTKLTAESLYVSDLLAVEDRNGLLRLCESDDHLATMSMLDDDDTERRLDILRGELGRLELHNLNELRAANAVATGFVVAHLRLGASGSDGLDEALASAGALLWGENDDRRGSLAKVWKSTERTSATSKETLQ